MATTSFSDSSGVEWTVWEVRPEHRERRRGSDRRVMAARGQERAAGTAAGRVERRSGVDRRVQALPRVIAPPGYEEGWLCFASAGERRRLTPIPSDWPDCGRDALEAYCAQADVATHWRRTG